MFKWSLVNKISCLGVILVSMSFKIECCNWKRLQANNYILEYAQICPLSGDIKSERISIVQLFRKNPFGNGISLGVEFGDPPEYFSFGTSGSPASTKVSGGVGLEPGSSSGGVSGEVVGGVNVGVGALASLESLSELLSAFCR